MQMNLIDSNLKDQTYKVNFTGGDPLIQHQAVAVTCKTYSGVKKSLHILESSCFDIDQI